MKPKYLFLFAITMCSLGISCKKKEVVDKGPKQFCVSDTMAKMITMFVTLTEELFYQILQRLYQLTHFHFQGKLSFNNQKNLNSKLTL